MLFASPSKFCLRRFFIFLTSKANLFVFQVGSHSVFVVQTRNGLSVISWERAWTLLILEVFRHYQFRGPNRSEKDHQPCSWDERIRRTPSQNAAFFTKSKHTMKLSSPVSTVYARNAWDFTSLLPSFLQHNLRTPVVLGCCLLVVVTKFQGKLASLQQVSSPNSQDNFQICCANMYLVRFLANFACSCEFHGFTWNSRLRDRTKYQKPCLKTLLSQYLSTFTLVCK